MGVVVRVGMMSERVLGDMWEKEEEVCLVVGENRGDEVIVGEMRVEGKDGGIVDR